MTKRMPVKPTPEGPAQERDGMGGHRPTGGGPGSRIPHPLSIHGPAHALVASALIPEVAALARAMRSRGIAAVTIDLEVDRFEIRMPKVSRRKRKTAR